MRAEQRYVFMLLMSFTVELKCPCFDEKRNALKLMLFFLTPWIKTIFILVVVVLLGAVAAQEEDPLDALGKYYY